MSECYDFSGLGFGPQDVVVVTGAASGIGRATAELAAAAGMTVSAWDMMGDNLAATVDAVDAPGKVVGQVVDVTDPSQVRQAWERASALGECRYLVNNAGPGSTADLTFVEGLVAAVGSMENVTEAWLASTGRSARAAVNVSSMAGNFTGGLGKDFYSTAKAGIAGLTRQLAVRHRGRPRVNAVAPGFIITPRTEPYLAREEMRTYLGRSPLGRAGTGAEVGAAILFLLSPAASNINGVLLPVDGGTVHV